MANIAFTNNGWGADVWVCHTCHATGSGTSEGVKRDAAAHACPTDMPSDECPCGGYIAWLDDGDYWDGSCYGQCGDYPRVAKSTT